MVCIYDIYKFGCTYVLGILFLRKFTINYELKKKLVEIMTIMKSLLFMQWYKHIFFSHTDYPTKPVISTQQNNTHKILFCKSMLTSRPVDLRGHIVYTWMINDATINTNNIPVKAVIGHNSQSLVLSLGTEHLIENVTCLVNEHGYQLYKNDTFVLFGKSQ